jgi:hypothetical protein
LIKIDLAGRHADHPGSLTFEDEHNNQMTPNQNTIIPRYEFRVFGRDLTKVRSRLESLSGEVPDAVKKRLSSEIYILSRTNDTSNCKIRDNKMDVKSLLNNHKGLEQWNPVLKLDFPLSKRQVIREVFPLLWTRCPLLSEDEYNLPDFLDLVAKHPDLLSVSIDKERFGFYVNETICEYARVYVNGALIHTVSCEDAEIEKLHKTISLIGLHKDENVNYQEAIKRVIGWSEGMIK